MMYTNHLTEPRIMAFYNMINQDTGNLHVDMGSSDGSYNIIERDTWKIRTYYEENFFRSRVIEGNHALIQQDEFLRLIKFVVDSVLIARLKQLRVKTGLRKTWSKNSFLVTGASFNNTAAAIQPIMAAWSKFAVLSGFPSLEPMVARFLYFDKGCGKLQVTEKLHCLPFSVQLEMVMTRNPRIDHPELEDIYEDKPVSMPIPRLDLAKSELPDDDVLKYVDDELFEELREVAKEFQSDLYKRLLSVEVLDRKNSAEDLNNSYLTDFNANGSAEDLPRRFTNLLPRTKRITEGIQRATLLANKEKGRMMETTGQIEAGTNEQEDTEEANFTCASDCTCRVVRKRLCDEGKLFPSLFECEDVCEFMDKLEKNLEDKTPYGDKIPGNVQLIFTNSVPENLRSHVRTPFETNRIVRACAELLRDGGHVLLRTTASKFEEYRAAFTAHEDASGRATFKVDRSAFILTTKPEEQAAKIDDNGPTHVDITIPMMHAMKIGKLEPEEIMKKIDLKPKGFIA